MNHRLCKRTNIIEDVVLYRSGQYVTRGKIRNVSLDGMFIETVATNYPVLTCVEVGFVTYKDEMAHKQHMRAYVIHRSNKGIGLMFVTLNDDQLLSINRLNCERGRCKVNAVAGSIL